MLLPDTKPYIQKRVAATFIDYTLTYVLTFFYIYVVGKTDENGSHVVTGLPALVPMLFWFLYFIICESFLDGTMGHHLFKIKVVSMDGSKPEFSQILLRRLADILEISWCFGLIAFITAKSTQNNQRLGDIWGKTIVVGNDVIFPIDQFDFEAK
ncbi:MAG TPA: RDD family protein [Puia sp.]|nr:RDD family protein [Puia sp.]